MNPDIATRDATSGDVAIVGGGLAGLSCAVAMRGSGLRVHVIEGGRSLGGRARSWAERSTEDVIDLGPHILVSEYGNMLALLRMLGTQERIVWQSDRLIRLIEPGRATDMHLHALPPPLHLLPSMAKVRSLSLRDKWSNLGMVKLAMHMDEAMVLELDRMSALELLRRHRVSDRFIKWFWASACMSVMNLPLDLCSAGALMRIAARLMGRKHYCIGLPSCGLAELFVPQARTVIESERGHIHLDAKATGLVIEDGRARGVRLDDGVVIRANHIILAVPPRELHALLAGSMAASWDGAALQSFEPCPYISTYLWFDRKVTSESFWSQVWNPDDLVTDFYDLSNIRLQWQSRPSVLASNIIFSYRAHRLSDAEIIRRTLNEASRGAPAVSQAVLRHAVVNRIPMAIVCPKPGTERLRTATTVDIEGLSIAGDWTGTGLPSCMESAVHSGFGAAERLWKAIGQPRQLVTPLPPTQGLARIAYLLSSSSRTGARRQAAHV